jgi:hypothetical protein
MPKLAQWAEDNTPEGLTVFALDLRASPKTQTTKFTIFNNKNPIKTLSQKHLR